MAEARPCPRCGREHITRHGHPSCTSHVKNRERAGGPCLNPPMVGQAVCHKHGGAARQNRTAAARRIETQAAQQAVATLGLAVDITPTEALLQEVQWTAGHVQWLRQQVSELEREALVWGTTRLETEPGTALALGLTNGELTDVSTGPTLKKIETAAPSIWYQLYTAERAHLVAVCTAALKAGVEERRVRLAEQQGDLVAAAIRKILEALNLTPAQQALVGTVVPRELRLIAGGTP